VDLDRFLDFYNTERSHQAYHIQDRTPARAIATALALAPIPQAA
jgi:hypothetical protein